MPNLSVYISLVSLVVCVNCVLWKNHVNVLAPLNNDTTNNTGCRQCTDTTSNNGESCWDCYSLGQALIKTNRLKTSVYVRIQSTGIYSLQQSIALQQISSFTLIAPVSTVIDCTDNAGISFNDSKQIHIKNIELNGCNALQYSTVSVNRDNFDFAKFSVSLYFLSCFDVTIEHVVIRNSPGVGLVFYNTGGSSVISNSKFLNNGDNMKYGGGVVIKYSNDMNHSTQTEMSKAVFTISETSFINNYAEAINDSPLRSSDSQSYLKVTLPSDNMKVFPGQLFNLTVNSYDLYSKQIATRVEICVHDGPVSLQETDHLGSKCLYGETANPIPVTLFSNYDLCNNSTTALLSVRSLSSQYSSPNVITPVDIICCPNHTNFSDSKCYLQIDQSNGIACANPEYCTIDNSPNADKCPLTYSLKISRVHCWNFEDNDDDNEYDNLTSALSQFIGGTCPYNYRTKFCELISNFNDHPNPCPANRAGRLCGKCDEDHGIAINTGDMECINCYYPKFPMWLPYLAIEFIYATILFAVVVMTKLSLNAGGTSAFIFYCQVITMKYPGLSYPSWVLEQHYDDTYKYTIARGFTVIYSITNLDFIIPFAEPFCLSKSLTPIHAITLEYLPAVYLLLLTFLVYCWVLLHNNRCNVIYRLTILITRNHDDDIANRKCKYVPNYFESFAVVALLCYTRIATTSVKFLHSTGYYNLKGEKLGTAFFYDGTLDFFGDGHIVYAIVAILILIVFVFLPALFLIVHPIVQTFLCPNCGNSLINTQSFTGCFKDGSKKKTRDYRYFAGVYFLLRIIIAFLYLEQDIETLLISQISIAIISASLFMTVRPYKDDNYNTIDGLFFVYLALLSGLSANGHYSICQKFLIHVPLVIVFVYAGYKAVLYLLRSKRNRIESSRYQPLEDVDSDDERLLEDSDIEGIFNRRLLNPVEYLTNKNQNDWRKKSIDRLLSMSK